MNSSAAPTPSCSSSSPVGQKVPSSRARSRARQARRSLPGALGFAVALAVSSEAAATPPALQGDAGRSAAVALAVGGAVLLSELALKPRLAPSPARWADRDQDGSDTLAPLDRSASRLRWSAPATAARVSDIGLAVSSLSALGLSALTASREGERLSDIALDLTIIAESTAVAMAVNQLTKFLAGRERPCKHFASAWARGAEPSGKGVPGPCGADRFDENLSSFSGHTTLVSSLWMASGTVALLRESRFAPLLFASGALFTAATGYLRIAAGKHYLSDVLVGALLGPAIGFFLPFTFHGRVSTADAGKAGPSPASSALSRRPASGAPEAGFRFSFTF